MYIRKIGTRVIKHYTPKTGDRVVFHSKNNKVQIIEFLRSGYKISTGNSTKLIFATSLETLKDMLLLLLNIQLIEEPCLEKTNKMLTLRIVPQGTPKKI